MNIERLNLIEETYHAALEIPVGGRGAFFKRHCGADEDLRREVESLLSFENTFADFLGAPLLDALAAEMFAETDETSDLIGKTVGRYEITELLGKGGMGEVYLAEDTKLKRRAALKFLPAELTGDANRLKRFEREAQTASALNHPNVLTIYEFGAENEFHFLAAEYVEGETLRQMIGGGDLSLADALGIAEQIAFALSATHQANVIHRDIKPENVMIRPDGIAKVLDFGLAKLSEIQSSPEAQTRAFFQTNPGTVMGTVTYMSPEQARGNETDARTDLWSLGVVLYEMLTGKPPFAGETTNDAIAAILTGEPPPLARNISDVPAELQRIVRKTLEKKRDERYQTARDLMIDIKSLRRELDLRREIERSNPSPTNGKHAVTIEGNAPTQNTGEDRGQPTQINLVSEKDYSSLDAENDYPAKDFVISPRAAGDNFEAATTVVAPEKTQKSVINTFLLSAIFALLLAGAGFVAYNQFFKTAPKSAAAAFDKIELDRLTADGLIVTTAISPDGKYVVFARKDADGQSLWLRQTDAPGEVNIVPAGGFDYQFLTVSKTEDWLYFVASESEKQPSAIYRTTWLGQNQKKIITGVDSQISFSPDGKKLAFVRSGENDDALLIADLETGAEKTLEVRKYPETYTEGVSWSPDGKRVAVATLTYGAGYSGGISVINIETGEKTALPFAEAEQAIRLSFIQWLPGGDGLFFCQQTNSTGARFQIRHISFPGGEIRNVTNDLTSYENVSVSADGKQIAAVQRDYSMSIWVIPVSHAEPAAQIKPYAGRDDGEQGVAWTGDGKIVYVSSDGGTENLWRMDADGGNQRSLTAGKDYGKSVPSLSADGRSLIFLTSENDELNFRRVNFDGQNQTPLTSDNIATIYPASANENFIVYTGDKNGEVRIWSKSFESEKAIQLTEHESWNPVISPDGKHIAFFQREKDNAVSLGLISIETKQLIRSLPLPAAVKHSSGLAWSKDGNSLLFVVSTGTFSNVWQQNTAGGAAKPLTDFKELQIAAFALSADGKSLAAARGSNNRDIVLIKNIR